MVIKTNDKWVNYSHGPTQTKQQVGKCVVGTFLVHKQATDKHKFIKLTTKIGRSHHLPPYSIICA
jgi:hypothetical protein